MTHKNWPELEDSQLLAYLDGEADPEVTEHVAQCEACRGRAGELALLQDRLTAGLYRSTCPSSTELGEYQMGLLPRAEAVTISGHVEDCPHCTRELVQLRAYLADLAPDVERGALEQVKILIAELVRGVQGLGEMPVLAPAPTVAGLRGDAQGPLVYQAGAYQISVETMRDGEKQDRFALIALVSGPETVGLEARLLGSDGQEATAPVDELGNLYFSGLTPGPYELNLCGPHVEIQIPRISVGEP